MDDDLWMDEIDDQMLIQASQMVEAAATEAAAEHQIDEATLSMLIKAVDEDPDFGADPLPSKGPSRFLQTQTVFKAPQLHPKPQNPPPKPTKQPSEESKLNDQLEDLKAENKRLQKDKMSRVGEISMLRDELRRRKREMDAEKDEKAKILEAKGQELKAQEDRSKAKLDSVKTERDFIARELDLAREALRNVERTQRRLPSQSVADQPALKRPRLENGSPYVPKTIDKSLIGDPMESKRTQQTQTMAKTQRKFTLSSTQSFIERFALLECQESVSVLSKASCLNSAQKGIQVLTESQTKSSLRGAQVILDSNQKELSEINLSFVIQNVCCNLNRLVSCFV